jgi:hypothetical protein
LAAGERCIADAFCGEQLVVAGDDEAVGGQGVASGIVGIPRGVEIEDAAVFN